MMFKREIRRIIPFWIILLILLWLKKKKNYVGSDSTPYIY